MSLKDQPLQKTSNPTRSWYDYPHYYDLGFRDETQRETNFFEQAFERFVKGRVHRLMEPGCGSGRLVVEMAARGYDVVGFDLNPKAIQYCRRRLLRRKLTAGLLLQDMANFTIGGKKFDAAFNTFNTFRHLLTEKDAISHLQLMARHVRPGGIYILGFHLLPLDCDLTATERWSASSGSTKIGYTLTVLESSRRKRLESLRISMSVRKPNERLRLVDTFSLRMYTAPQFRSLLTKVPEWQIEQAFDFWYEIDEPQEFDNRLVDALFILKRI